MATKSSKVLQYQQNQHSPLISLNIKKTTTDDVGNPDPGIGQAQNVAELSS